MFVSGTSISRYHCWLMQGWEKASVLRTVLEGSGEHIILVDRDHKITHMNWPLPGQSETSMVGQYAADFVPSERDKVTAAFDRAFESGNPDDFEVVFASPEGPILWSCRVLPIVENGVTESLAVLSRNITEETQKEAARKRFFTLSRDLLCTASLEGYFKSVTPAFTSLLGYSEAELLARPFTEFVHSDDVEPTIAVIRRMGEDGSIDDFENRYLDTEGNYHRIYWSGIYDYETKLIYAVGRDITEKRRTEDTLLQSQKLDAVGQLAGGLAHDFNNIVQAVMMNVELATREAKSPVTEECLGEIMTAGERAGAITQQLLSFSKSDVFQPIDIDLRDVVGGLHNMIRRLLPESMEIETLLGDEPVYSCVDRGQIEQVIVNLSINARDAMPQTGGKLTLALGKEDEMAVLRVVDNGTGMTVAVQQRMFEPYFTTKDRGLGTGLGLSSVYTVVKRHHGRLDVDSTIGQGTEIRVQLPQGKEPPRPHASTGDSEGERAIISGQRVLVAEDDSQVREVVVQVLQAEGFTVYEACDGEEAIQLAAQANIDLALLDLVMPKASGHDVFLALRRRFPNLPVVFSTGYADGRLPDKTLADQRVALLRKPYRPEALCKALIRLLARNS